MFIESVWICGRLSKADNVEITSRMASYKIPEKLNQLEINYQSRDCLDTAIATNMIAVGMDVDRLGLMVVTGQPKQNSEYIQATSRIGRAFPGLVVTLYNAYRPRDLSHYENFTGYLMPVMKQFTQEFGRVLLTVLFAFAQFCI